MGNAIVLSGKDMKIIDAIGYVLKKNKKIMISSLNDEVSKLIGTKTGWIAPKIKYCLLILYIKRKIGIRNNLEKLGEKDSPNKRNRGNRWKTWIWLIGNRMNFPKQCWSEAKRERWREWKEDNEKTL